MAIISLRKGLTPVVAIILLLLITISITGAAFLFFSRVTETSAQAGEEQLQEQASQSGGLPRILAVDKNKVHVKNIGSVPLTNPTFFVAGTKVDVTGPPSLAPGEFGTYLLDEVQLAPLPQVAEVKIATAGFSDSIIATIKDIVASIVSMGTVLTTGMLVAGDPAISFHDSAGNDLAIITDAGDMGIGTTSPGQKLDVAGQIHATGDICTDLAGGTCLSTAGGGGITGSGISNYVAKFTGASAVGNSQIFDNDGNVGIGTTAPAGLLHLNSSLGAGVLRVENTTGASLLFVNGTTGRVGIRTTTPGGQLHVVESVAGVAATLIVDQTSSGGEAMSIAAGLTAIGLQFSNTGDFTFSSNSISTIRTGGSSGAVQRFIVRGSSGNVGIGTTPNARLHVAGGDVAITTQGNGIILRATDGTNCYRVTVNNAGTLSTTLVACP